MKNKYSIILRIHGERNIALQDYFASFPFQNLREHPGDPPKSCTSELKYQQDTIEEISFFLLLTNYGSQHVVHACFNMLCFNVFATCVFAQSVCIALSLHWFSLSPKWFQAYDLLCWWCLFCAPEASQMWCNVMCTHLFCCVWKQTDVEIALECILSFTVLNHSLILHWFFPFLNFTYFQLQNSDTSNPAIVPWNWNLCRQILHWEDLEWACFAGSNRPSSNRFWWQHPALYPCWGLVMSTIVFISSLFLSVLSFDQYDITWLHKINFKKSPMSRMSIMWIMCT